VSKLITCVLLLLFASDMAVPFLPADSGSALPACCRRGGKHQCAMMSMNAGDGDDSPKVAADRCQSFPQRDITANTDSSSAPPALQSIISPAISHPAAKAQTEAHYRVSHSRVRQKRGPPFLS